MIKDYLVTFRDTDGVISNQKVSYTVVPDPVVVPPPVIVAPPVVIPPVTASNEPAGMSKITERDFASKTFAGWYYSEGFANSITIVSDPTAPKSAGSVMQQNFTSQCPGGSSPATVAVGLPARQTLYVDFYQKYSSNYIGHGTGVNKVLHFWISGRNTLVFVVRGAGTGVLKPSFGVQGMAGAYKFPDGRTDYNGDLNSNLAQTEVIRNKWQHYELSITANTPGVADGTVEFG